MQIVRTEELDARNRMRLRIRWGLDGRGALWHSVQSGPTYYLNQPGDYQLVELADGSVFAFYLESFEDVGFNPTPVER